MIDSSFWRAIWFIPSFYGMIFWNLGLAAYLSRLIQWNEPNAFALAVFLLVSAAQVTSILIHGPAYTRWYEARLSDENSRASDTLLLLFVLMLHTVGFLGLGLYWRQLIQVFGSPEAVALALATESYQIRAMSDEISSVGIQFSYVGWLAIALSAMFLMNRRWSSPLLLLSIGQLLGNLTFVDRTRPIWILVCAGLSAMAMDRGQISRRPWLLLGSIATAGIGLFVLIGSWIGKVGGDAGGYGATSLEGFHFSIYLYATGGFAYANEVLGHQSVTDWLPQRVAYPLFKLFAAVGLTSTPVSQIADFLYVPYPTNVGTFLEPFLNDGGLIFALVGVAIYTFVFDYVGLICLRSRRLLPTYFWGNLCFSSLIGFFTPKIGSTPFWLFLLLAVWSLGVAWVMQSINELRRAIHSNQAPVPK